MSFFTHIHSSCYNQLGIAIALYNRRAMSASCTMIAAEWSTMFLNVLLFSRHPAYKSWVAQNMPWLQIISGFGLW